MAEELNDKITQAINEWLLGYEEIQDIAEIINNSQLSSNQKLERIKKLL